MAQLSECIYLSRSLIAPHSVDLLDIERAAMRNNPKHGISGCLYVDATFFVQLLEGPEPAIDCMLTALRRDRRHIGMLILRMRPLTQRRFANGSLLIHDGTATCGASRLRPSREDLARAESGDASGLLQYLDQFQPTGSGH
ncbi:MAG: BLUF domain-containing protein [Natronohydrobacter sp.]|nr:BLUF domain-containing protein [Natronohydrobacter sp.]